MVDDLELQPALAPGLERWCAFYVETVANPSGLGMYMCNAAGEHLTDADSLVILALVPMVAVLRDRILRHMPSPVLPRLTLILPAACWQQPDVIGGGRLLDMSIWIHPRATWPAVAVEVP